NRLVAEVGDVSLTGMDLETAELARRGNDFKKALPGIFAPPEIEFRLIHGLDQTTFERIRDDFLNQTARHWAIMDGPWTTDGSEGLVGPFHVVAFPWEQNLEDASGHPIRLRLAYFEYA